MRTFTISLALGWLIAGAAISAEPADAPTGCASVETCGDPGCCGRCGRHCGCEKYCKVVCETKEIKKHVWVVKCSDFCAALPNCGGKCCGGCAACRTAEAACCEGGGEKCNPCASEENKCLVPPKCGKVREKKTLEKKEITCKAPSYKCVVVYCCPHCGAEERNRW